MGETLDHTILKTRYSLSIPGQYTLKELWRCFFLHGPSHTIIAQFVSTNSTIVLYDGIPLRGLFVK